MAASFEVQASRAHPVFAPGHGDPTSARPCPLAGKRKAAIRTTAPSPVAATAPYTWPLRPFDRQHPVRGFLGDPRIGRTSQTLHLGIDIAAADGTPVYAIEGGEVFKTSARALFVSRQDGSRAFTYWHIVPAVKGHQVVARHQLLGWVAHGWKHVHLGELWYGVYLNPLRPGALHPYRDTTTPTIARIALLAGRGGRLSVIVDASDLPSPPVPGPWTGEPVAPALLQWRVERDGRPDGGWRTAADFRTGISCAWAFDSVYAPATRENREGRPGVYRFWLIRNWQPADGHYLIEVRAADTRGNIGLGQRHFTYNGHGTIPASADNTAPRLQVRNKPEFETAVAELRESGGTIVLLRHDYRNELVVPPRSARPLQIIGVPGVHVERILLDHTQHVSLGQFEISPVAGDSWIKVSASEHIDLHDLLVSAAGTRHSASLQLPDSRYVTIRRSVFTHCGDRSPAWSNCLLLGSWASHVTVADNWFHDCYGCDFIHGRFGTDLTIVRNRFERALPCRIGRIRCGHQDLIEMFAGQRLRVVANHFGVYRKGGAQLYLTDAIDHITIVNNTFIGTDPRVPGYHARVALIIGGAGPRRVPHDVEVVNNTILTGARRVDGYAGSIRMSSLYGGVPRAERPILANNVIGLLEVPNHVCSELKASLANVVLVGTGCSRSDRVGSAGLDRSGRPTASSTLLIGRANRSSAPATDITGRRRDRTPDIGAYEYRATR